MSQGFSRFIYSFVVARMSEPQDMFNLSISDKANQKRITTADTRGPPDVNQNTHVIAILGVFEDTYLPDGATPSVGDGWFISDFYLWMNVLKGN